MACAVTCARACAVLAKKSDGSYILLAATVSGNTATYSVTGYSEILIRVKGDLTGDGKLDSSDDAAFHAAFERQLSWLNFMDDCTADARLVFSDGSSLAFAGSAAYQWLDDERILTSGGSWAGTIDVHDVVAVEVAGQRIELRGT